jgi:hypothetical protein
MKASEEPQGDPADFLNDTELGERLGIAPVTLRGWRMAGTGPPFYKLGRRVVYSWPKVQAWLATHERGTI